MAKSKTQRILVAVLCVIAIVFISTGIYGVAQRTGEKQEALLSDMRMRALLLATGEGAVESFVKAAQAEAVAKVRAEGGNMEAIRAASDKAAEDVIANASASLVDFDEVDTKPLQAAVLALRSAMADYNAESVAALALYVEQNADKVIVEEEAEVIVDAPPAAEGDVSAGVDELALVEEETVAVDLSDFTDTPEMIRLMGIANEKFTDVEKAITVIYPLMDSETIAPLKPLLLSLVSQANDKYETEFDRYAAAGGLAGLKGEQLTAQIIRYGDDLITIGVALIFAAMMVLFHTAIVSKMGLPLLIIGSFFILLCVLAVTQDLSITGLLSNAIVRMGMNSIMVLAMVPAIQCGIALNLGLPVGIIGGLIGGLMAIEFGFSGWWSFLFANLVGIAISIVLGYAYGLMLNKLKGSEMAVTTYVGFSIVSLMCIAWLVLPFKSLELKWPLGNGLRTTVSLENAFQYLLDRFWAFKIFGVTIPTGLLLFMGLCCFAMWLFTRSKTGIAMQAVGNNPRFAQATGINVNKMRIIGTILSTILGSVGILVYSQSFGFMQLYTAPRTLGLIAASAVLIGGASTTRAKISHVLIGTFLFHSVLTLGMPVANALIPGSTVAETIRILVSNGIILYALTKSGGGSRA